MVEHGLLSSPNSPLNPPAVLRIQEMCVVKLALPDGDGLKDKALQFRGFGLRPLLASM